MLEPLKLCEKAGKNDAMALGDIFALQLLCADARLDAVLSVKPVETGHGLPAFSKQSIDARYLRIYGCDFAKCW